MIFQRNRYYYGKLMTVKDFQLEQEYMNGKRGLQNRMLTSGGVLCGLQVQAAGEDAVSVGYGAALDYCGREVVVGQDVTAELKGTDGVLTDNGRYAYLCLEYQEQEEEAVYTPDSEAANHNRIAERYRLFFSPYSMPHDLLGVERLYWDRRLIYKDNRGRFLVYQNVPKYIRQGYNLDIMLEVIRLKQDDMPIEYRYTLTCGAMKAANGEFAVKFQEGRFSQGMEYVHVESIPMKAEIPSHIRIGVKGGGDDLSWEVYWTEKEINQLLRERYLDEKRRLLKDNVNYSLYLAKVYFHLKNDKPVIDKIESLPYNQYIGSNRLEYLMDELGRIRTGQEHNKELEIKLAGFMECYNRWIEQIIKTSTGTVNLKFPANAYQNRELVALCDQKLEDGKTAKARLQEDIRLLKSNPLEDKSKQENILQQLYEKLLKNEEELCRWKTVSEAVKNNVPEEAVLNAEHIRLMKQYSRPFQPSRACTGSIAHRLGKGDVQLTYSYRFTSKNNDKKDYTGNSQIINEKHPDVSFASELDCNRESFQIGGEYRSYLEKDQETVIIWNASRAGTGITGIDIKPHIPVVPCGEGERFICYWEGKEYQAAEWEVVEPGGGTIDSKGRYQAPAVPGIYEIRVNIPENGNQKEHTYVIAKEK